MFVDLPGVCTGSIVSFRLFCPRAARILSLCLDFFPLPLLFFKKLGIEIGRVARVPWTSFGCLSLHFHFHFHFHFDIVIYLLSAHNWHGSFVWQQALIFFVALFPFPFPPIEWAALRLLLIFIAASKFLTNWPRSGYFWQAKSGKNRGRKKKVKLTTHRAHGIGFVWTAGTLLAGRIGY